MRGEVLLLLTSVSPRANLPLVRGAKVAPPEGSVAPARSGLRPHSLSYQMDGTREVTETAVRQPLVRESCPTRQKQALQTALYVHIPFCIAKCHYCDFNSYAGMSGFFQSYVAVLVREIEMMGRAQERTGRSVEARSVYFGGGTPTVLPVEALERILGACFRCFHPCDSVEVTVELRPGTLGLDEIARLKEIGVTRLSIGVQSFQEGELRVLGRGHSARDSMVAYRRAQEAGFRNINVDLMYGLPGQTLESWTSALERALGMKPDHLSLYPLTLADGTILGGRVAKGDVVLPDQDQGALMYERAEALLEGSGYVHYEISNWARGEDGRGGELSICEHNMAYWRAEPYLGFGAGAHSLWRNCCYHNASHPADYIRRLNSHGNAICESRRLDERMRRSDYVILGLRLCEGVRFEDFVGRFGLPFESAYGAQLVGLEREGLVESDAVGVRLTPRGRLLGNEVFERFL